MPPEQMSDLKKGELPSLNEYMLPLCTDMDPDQGIEREYMKKNNQVFCWRFLRAVSCVDLSNFHGKTEQSNRFVRFEGNVEEQAELLHKKAKKREIVEHVENEDGAVEEEQEQNGVHDEQK